MKKKIYSKTFCKMPFVGLQATHRGHRLCCVSKESNINGIKEFWHSKYLKDVREKMRQGEKVADCEICYNKEAEGKVSLRNHYNSLYKNLPIESQPTALDLDFSNLCNLKCIMCGPDRSSQWTKELGEKTLTPLSKEQIDELCQLSDNVEHITIQGGEPSIMPEFEYYFQYLKEKNLIGKIKVDCISNLTNINNKFYELLEHFKSVSINASVDAYDQVNNYIRYPSKFTNIEKNLIELSKKNFQVNLQITLQTLSMYNFYDFLVWISSIQKQYKKEGKTFGLNIQYVRSPNYLDIKNSPEKLKEKMLLDIKRFRNQNNNTIKDVKFNIELRAVEQLLSAGHQPRYINELKAYLNTLDNRRSIKITNYIPNFHHFM